MRYDGFLEKRLSIYDRWLSEKKVPYASKVIPVGKSLEAKQWVLPNEQAMEFLRNARIFALGDCDCRTRYKRCDNPVDTCLFLNDMADYMIKKEKAREIDLKKAEEVLRLADEHGLVHLTLYSPEQYPYCLCSCCSCCCHDLQLLINYDRKDLIAHSEYVAQDNTEDCVHCGACVDRCVFGARVMENGLLKFDPNVCYGCGLCVSTCPSEAIEMVFRHPVEKAQAAED
jgi:ferredoxin